MSTFRVFKKYFGNENILLIFQSTYCSYLEKHAQVSKRSIRVVNLDPAAEKFNYEPLADVRNLIQVADAMEDEDLKLGKIIRDVKLITKMHLLMPTHK